VFAFFENREKTKRALSLTDEPWEKIFAALNSCMKSAQITPDQVDLVCLTESARFWSEGQRVV
jgi:hypothetical protein